MLVMLGQQMNRLIAGSTKAIIDTSRQARDSVLKVAIFIQRAARGGCYLEKNKAPDPLGLLL